jgi:hypothetical protein
MRQVLVFEVIIFRLQPAFDQVERKVNQDRKHLCNYRSPQKHKSRIYFNSKLIIHLLFRCFVKEKVWKTTKNRTIETSWKSSAKTHYTFFIVNLTNLLISCFICTTWCLCPDIDCINQMETTLAYTVSYAACYPESYCLTRVTGCRLTKQSVCWNKSATYKYPAFMKIQNVRQVTPLCFAQSLYRF